MRQVGDHMRLAEQLAPCTLKCVGGGIGRVPFGNDVVIGDVLQSVADRNEVGFLWIAGPAFSVHGIEQAIPRKFRMKDKSDETAFEPVVHAIGKSFGDVSVYLRPVVLINQVEKAAGIVGEAAAVGKFAHIADPRPSRRRHVLIGRTNPSSVRKAHDIPDLDRKSALLDPSRNRVAGDLAVNSGGSPECKSQNDRKRRPYTHESSYYSDVANS